MSDAILSPDIFTADYVGRPGDRTFYLQARSGTDEHTYLVEKQQVSALAEKLRELLLLVDQADPVGSAPPARDPALRITPPVAADARVGTLGLAFEEDSDSVIVLVQTAEEDGEAEQGDEENFGIRFVLRRDQARAFVLHTAAIVSEGRPLCQLCGLPIDPQGHKCPASNGHRLGG